MKKNSCTPINPKKYPCYGLKTNHTRNLITKNNSCGSKGGPSKEKQAGTRNICLLYLAGIFLNPSTLFPVLALFFTRESCLTPQIEAHNRKKRPSEIVSDDRKRIKFAYFAILLLAVFKHWCPKDANVIQLTT